MQCARGKGPNRCRARVCFRSNETILYDIVHLNVRTRCTRFEGFSSANDDDDDNNNNNSNNSRWVSTAD